MRTLLIIGLSFFLSSGAAWAAETGAASATQPVEAKDLAGPDDGLLPGAETALKEAMKFQVTLVAACQAVAPPRLVLGYSGVINATQTFRLLDSFYGQENAGAAISIRYSYLDPTMGFSRTHRAVRSDEKVIWIFHHDSFGGDHGIKALPDTPANRLAARNMVEQLPADLPEKVEAAKAEARLTQRLFAIKPKGWSGGSMSRGKIEPMHWDPGDGVRFMWNTMDVRPDLKDGHAGQVTVWIMDAGYSGKRKEDAARQAQAVPAVEVATWRGRRVFFCGGGADWPTAQADILQAITEKAAADPANTPATTQAVHAEAAFKYGDKLIHPLMIRELVPLISAGHLAYSVNLDENDAGNRFAEKVQKLPNGDLSCELSLSDTANGQGYFAYRHLGILQGGTHVLVTYWNGGGSGVFQDLLFIRFVVQKFRGIDGAAHERHLMDLVDSFGLGDRDSGEIRLMADRVTVGPWKERKAAVVLLEPQIVTAR